MAVKDLTTTEIVALIATRDPSTGFEYPASGLQPWYNWLIRSLHHLGQAGAGSLMVKKDDANDTTVAIMPARVTLSGEVLAYASGTIDLAAFNNNTAYLWLYDTGTPGSPIASIGSGAISGGWPTVPHIKLAEVTLASGQITTILDRRYESMMIGGFAHNYGLAITAAGSTISPSTITVTTTDLHGVAIAKQNILRVRVCDASGYADATNATIAPAPGGDTTTLETVTASKDLVLQSHTDGKFEIELTDATAETVTLRIGPPPLSGLRSDYSTTIDVTHA